MSRSRPIPQYRWQRARRWLLPFGVLFLVRLGCVVVVGRPHATDWPTIQAAIDRKDWPAAEAMLARRVSIEPDDGRAWLALGSTRGLLGQFDPARAALEHVAAADPNRARARLMLGDLLAKKYDAAGAEAAWRDAIAHDGGTEPRLRLLRLLLVERRLREARSLLLGLFHRTGESGHLRAATGLALEAASDQFRDLNGENARLLTELQPWLDRAPDNPWLRRARGLLRLDLGHLAEARADLDSARSKFAEDPAVVAAAIACRLSLGELDGIDAVFGEPPAKALPTDRASWWFLRGRVDEERGQIDAAIRAWREAIAADSGHPGSLHALGVALRRTGQNAEADAIQERADAARTRFEQIRDRLSARRGRPDDAEACEALGRLCCDAGLQAEGRGWLERAVRLDPTRVAAQAELAGIDPSTQSEAPLPRLRPDRPAAEAPVSPAAIAAASGAKFEDMAEARGLVYRYDSGATGDLFIGDTMGGGVGLIDYDRDGWLDVYHVNGGSSLGTTNRLFRNKGGGWFEDVTDRAGVPGRGTGMGCAVGDYDGDGHDDLFITGLSSTILYHNNGDGTFRDVTAAAGVGSDRWTTAAGFADLDGDGDLDLVAVTYVAANPGTAPPCHDALDRRIHCPPGKFPAQVDHLFRNNGDGTFTDVAREAGLDVPNGRGLGLAIADFDDDGRLDLFVANDAVPDFLFHNEGGLRFTEVAPRVGAAFNGNGASTASMGVVAADLDADGRIDLFHTNFRNEGNTLLRNLGGGRFADGSAGAGLDGPSRPITGFGAVAIDGDNDGRLDLFVANGHVDDQPWLNQPMAQRPHWYAGRTRGRFAVAPPGAAGPFFDQTRVGRGVAAGDLDGDGRVDLVVVQRDGPVALLRNISPREDRHWLGVQTVGTRSGRLAVGTRVTCRAGGQTQVRWVTAGTSYLAASDPRPWFGLGSASTVDELEVRWPSGVTSKFTAIAADRVVEAVEPDRP